MQSLIDSAGTVLLVSHSPKQLETMCDRGVWIHEGKIIADGNVEEVSAQYQEWVKLKGANDFAAADEVIEQVQLGYSSPNIVFK